ATHHGQREVILVRTHRLTPLRPIRTRQPPTAAPTPAAGRALTAVSRSPAHWHRGPDRSLIDQMTHPMQHATDSQSCSKFWIRHSRPSTQMEDHMAKEDKPIPIEELWKKGASIPFTRDYEHHTFFTHKTIPHVTKALITRPIEAFSVKSRTRTSAWRRMVSAYVQCP